MNKSNYGLFANGQQQMFNWSWPQSNWFSISGLNSTKSEVEKPEKSTPTKSNVSKNKTFDLQYWQKQGYNKAMGEKLAEDAVANCKYKADGGCVGYTRKTLNRLYGTDMRNAGAAYKFGDKIKSNKVLASKFKKINKKDIEKYGVPDGAIVLYNPGSRGLTKGKAALYGHGGIACNNFTYSDIKFGHIETCSEIWIPV